MSKYNISEERLAGLISECIDEVLEESLGGALGGVWGGIKRGFNKNISDFRKASNGNNGRVTTTQPAATTAAQPKLQQNTGGVSIEQIGAALEQLNQRYRNLTGQDVSQEQQGQQPEQQNSQEQPDTQNSVEKVNNTDFSMYNDGVNTEDMAVPLKQQKPEYNSANSYMARKMRNASNNFTNQNQAQSGTGRGFNLSTPMNMGDKDLEQYTQNASIAKNKTLEESVLRKIIYESIIKHLNK